MCAIACVLLGCGVEDEQKKAAQTKPDAAGQAKQKPTNQTGLAIGDSATVGTWKFTVEDAFLRSARGPDKYERQKGQQTYEEKALQSKGADEFLILKGTLENTGAQPVVFSTIGVRGPFEARDSTGNSLSRDIPTSFQSEMKAQGSRDHFGGINNEEIVPAQLRGVWLGWAAKADDDVTFVFQPSANSPAAGGQGPRAEWDIGPVSELGRGLNRSS
jgi:hypothetical protein